MRRPAAFVSLAVFALLSALEGPRLLAQIMSGGSWTAPMSFFASGGGTAADSAGVWSLSDVIGAGASAPSSGGSFQVDPGLYGAQTAAQADLSSAHAFPTEFRPSRGEDRITFRGLTTDATIKIYTLSGRLVQTLQKSDPTSEDLIWNPVANSAGEALASGVYYYVITGDSKTHASGKIMVIK